MSHLARCIIFRGGSILADQITRSTHFFWVSTAGIRTPKNEAQLAPPQGGPPIKHATSCTGSLLGGGGGAHVVLGVSERPRNHLPLFPPGSDGGWQAPCTQSKCDGLGNCWAVVPPSGKQGSGGGLEAREPPREPSPWLSLSSCLCVPSSSVPYCSLI